MMKKLIRIVSLILVLSTLFSLSAYAAETEDNWVNILDFDLGSSNSNYISFKETGSLTYQLPYASFFRYFQGLVQCNSDNLDSMTWSRANSATRYGLNLIHLGNGLYRFYSEYNSLASDTIHLHFSSSSSGTVYAQVVEFQYSPLRTFHYNDIGKMIVTTTEVLEYTMSSNGDDIYHYFSKAIETNYLAKFTCENWKKYDRLSFFVYIYDLDINSVTGRLGSHDIPIEIDYINDNDFNVGERYAAVFTLDLSSVDRNTTEVPYVEVSGLRSGLSDLSSFIGLLSVSGNVSIEEVDLLPYLLKTYLSDIGDTLTDTYDMVSRKFDEISSVIQTNFSTWGDSIYFILGEIDGSIDGFQDSFDRHFQEFVDGFCDLTDRLFDWKDNWFLFWEDFDGFRDDFVLFWDDVLWGLSELVGQNYEGDDLTDASDDLNDQITDVQDFEEQQQEVLDNSLPEMKESVAITDFSSALAFVSGYLNLAWLGIVDFQIIFLMPIFIGLFFFICGRLPGATRWNYRPPRNGGNS